MKIARESVMLILVAAISGCAVTPTTSAKRLQQLQEQDQARVVARTTALRGLIMNPRFNLSIKEVDGVNVQVNKYQEMQDKTDITLAPGKHSLGIDCDFMAGLPETDTMVDVVLVGGHVYEISARSQECDAMVTDITDTITQEPGH